MKAEQFFTKQQVSHMIDELMRLVRMQCLNGADLVNALDQLDSQ